MIPRIYLSPSEQQGSDVLLDAEQSLYVCQALRLRAGESLQVFDGRGNRREAILKLANKKAAQISLGESAACTPPSAISITLLQGVASGDRMDWVIEKAVELGVATIVPVLTERVSFKLSAERAAKRLNHWQRIAIAACRQSGRDDLPELLPVCSLSTALKHQRAQSGQAFVLQPANYGTLADHLLAPRDQTSSLPSAPVSLLVGPESGLSDEEVERAAKAGFLPASLGPRVLRTETAGLVAATIVQTCLGDFRPR